MEQTPADRILAAREELPVQGDAVAAAEDLARSFMAHVVGRDLRGLLFVRGLVEQFRQALVDLQVEFESLAREGARLAWQRALWATHRVALRGFPATGRTIVRRGRIVSRLEGAKTRAQRAVSDLVEHLPTARR